MTRRSEGERFWGYVLWTAGVDGKQKILRPQRTALTGHELTPDVLILHRCDVPLCVRADLDLEQTTLFYLRHRMATWPRRIRQRHGLLLSNLLLWGL